MTDPEIKNLIARVACSGLSCADKAFPEAGYHIVECDLVEDGSRGGLSRSVQLTLKGADNWPRVFEFTVRELIG